MAGTEFLVTVTFESDWHVGSGTGRPGDIDRLVVRHAEDELPCVPAKTLTGILRDAAESLAAALDRSSAGANGGSGDHQNWQQAVRDLFGDQPALGGRRFVEPRPALRERRFVEPRPALVRFDAARYRPALADVLATPELVGSVCFVKPGVAIDPTSGRARQRFLRMEEMARAGSELEAPGFLDLDPDDEGYRQCASLLVAAAALVERVGGKRRRGSGRCRVGVEGLGSLAEAHDFLAASPSPPWARGLRAASRGADAVTAAGNTPAGTVLEVPFELLVQSPVICPKQVVGNVTETFGHVPGSYLLGLAARALARAGLDATDAIRHGRLIALPATPVLTDTSSSPRGPASGGRAYRPPLALHAPKHGPNDAAALNGLDEGGWRELADPARGWGQRPLRKGWITLAGARLARDSRTTSFTHGTIDDARQRPSEDAGGGVYTYEGIAPGTMLAGSFLLRAEPDDPMADALWGIDAQVRIGRSRKDDYGRCTLSVQAPSARQQPDPPSGELNVWCLSDVVLHDEALHPVTTADAVAAAIGETLGRRVDVLPVADDEPAGTGAAGGSPAVADHGGEAWAYLRTTRTDSWHATWTRPRPSIVAVEAGTCLRVRVDATPAPGSRPATGRFWWRDEDGQVLAMIGERTAEGFGLVALDPPLLRSRTVALRPATWAEHRRAQGAHGDGRQLSARDAAFLAAVEREHWRREIELAAMANSRTAEWRRARLGWTKDRPSRSQLGGLRQAVRRLDRYEGEDNEAMRWWRQVQDVEKRRRQWDRARDETTALLSRRDHVFDLLSAQDRSVPEHLRDELWGTAVRALVDAAVAAHRSAPADDAADTWDLRDHDERSEP